MSPRIWILLGALLAAIAVGLGAYHAHGLEKVLHERGLEGDELQRKMHDFDTGVRYQMFHALALICVGLFALQAPTNWLNAGGALFVAGMVLFSACLYVPILAAMKLPPLLVPAGGLSFILGWIAVAIAAFVTDSPI
jgi:uncharacterized membrane protein YgdD (TMEM256/DUF423 family)